MTYILEIGDRRRLKAGIRVLHHTGHRAPCSDGRLNFAEARRATSAQPSPSEEDTPSSKNGKAKETVHPCCKYRRKGKSVRELLRQPHTPLSSGGRLRLRCPLRQGRPRRRVALDGIPELVGEIERLRACWAPTAADEQRSRNVCRVNSTVRCQGTDQAQVLSRWTKIGRTSVGRPSYGRRGPRTYEFGRHVARTENGPNFR